MNEIWVNIPEYENHYMVSNLGRVKSLKRNKEIIMSLNPNKDGYLAVHLYKNGSSRIHYVHQLVLMSFTDYKRGVYNLVVDHINNIKTDNRLENLQTLSIRENSGKTNIKYTSLYKGVSLYKDKIRWHSSIHIDGKKKNLGIYINELDAKKAYEDALLQIK
jgi:hypothetical protein